MREIKGFNRPFCVDMNSKGQILVGDFSDRVVSVFDLETLKKIHTLEAPFMGPHSIAIDQNENIFVCDYSARKVFEFSSDFKFKGVALSSSGFYLTGPAMCQFDKEWNFVVSDYGSHSVQRFSRDGKFMGWVGRKDDEGLSEWGMNGFPKASKLIGGFDRLHSVAFDDEGYMYVADTCNQRIQKFHKDGRLDSVFNDFINPVSIDMEHNIMLVAEFEGNAISCVLSSGYRLWQKKGFNHPYDVKLRHGKILVADDGNKRVVIDDF